MILKLLKGNKMALKKLDQNDQAEITRLFSQAPDWVRYISFDEDGAQSWWELKPRKIKTLYADITCYTNDNGKSNGAPFDGLHFENQTYANCCIERPRFKSKGASHPNIDGFEPTDDTPAYQVVRDMFNGLRNWRQTQKNIESKEAADEVKRLINWGK